MYESKFHNLKGYNTAQITVECKSGLVELFYHLSDNPVQHIWQENYADAETFYMGVSNGITKEDATAKLNELCVSVGEPTLSVPVTQDSLNLLHRKFVKHEASENKAWHDINFYIHTLEYKLDDTFEEFAEYNTTISFYKLPIPTKHTIKEEYKLWLTTELKWGRLLLGYETIGKDWLDVSRDEDDLHDLNVQSEIGSETILVFNVEQPYALCDVTNFYNWATCAGHNVPLDNLNQLALGKYLLGELILTDTFLNFHPVVSDWYVPNHKCKLNWNKEILGTTPVIKSVKFFNSDLCHDTMLRHTQHV